MESKEMFKKAKDNILDAILNFFIMMLLKVLMIILTVGSSIKYFGEQEIVAGVIYAVLAIIWGSLVFFEIRLLIWKIKHELKGLELLNQFNENRLKLHELEKEKLKLEEENQVVKGANNYWVMKFCEVNNKNKEQEKMIELMAKELAVCGGFDYVEFGMSTGDFNKDIKNMIDYFKKKAKGE